MEKYGQVSVPDTSQFLLSSAKICGLVLRVLFWFSPSLVRTSLSHVVCYIMYIFSPPLRCKIKETKEGDFFLI